MENNNIINLLIIEDNELYSTALQQFLTSNLENSNYCFSVQTFKTSERCLEALSSNNIKPHIVILDYYLNSEFSDAMNGVNALFHLKVFNPGVEVILLSSQNNMMVTVDALRTGAFDYIVKDEDAFQQVYYSIQECLMEMKKGGKVYPEYKRKDIYL